MPLADTVTKAIKKAGTQQKLADLIGEDQSNISAFKRGTRACGTKKRAHLAAIAEEDAARLIIEGVIESLSDDTPHEAEAKKGLMAMLDAFPEKAWRST